MRHTDTTCDRCGVRVIDKSREEEPPTVTFFLDGSGRSDLCLDCHNHLYREANKHRDTQGD